MPELNAGSSTDLLEKSRQNVIARDLQQASHDHGLKRGTSPEEFTSPPDLLAAEPEELYGDE